MTKSLQYRRKSAIIKHLQNINLNLTKFKVKELPCKDFGKDRGNPWGIGNESPKDEKSCVANRYFGLCFAFATGVKLSSRGFT